MKEILLIGGGGHCHSVIDVIEQEAKYRIAGVIDKPELLGTDVLGYQVIGCDDDLQKLSKNFQYACITIGQIGTAAVRRKVANELEKFGFILPVITSPLAYVSMHACIGNGTVVMHHAIVNAKATIGKNCIINTKALIEHDANIQDFCHVATAAVVNGGVELASDTFFGSNATSKQAISANGFIKAGSVAT